MASGIPRAVSLRAFSAGKTSEAFRLRQVIGAPRSFDLPDVSIPKEIASAYFLKRVGRVRGVARGIVKPRKRLVNG